MSTVVYVEGGGDAKSTRLRCQEGFRGLIDKLLPGGRRPRIVACGTRRAAFDRFVDGLRQHGDDACLLLVDSEGPLPDGLSPWERLARSDAWQRPTSVGDEHVHLMVQCMEAWLIADDAALARFYGQGFKIDSLPRRTNVEHVRKEDVSARPGFGHPRDEDQGPVRQGPTQLRAVGARVSDARRRASAVRQALLRRADAPLRRVRLLTASPRGTAAVARRSA